MVERLAQRFPNLVGGAIAATIIALWAVGLVILLSVDFSFWPPWTIPILVAVQTMLYTGLFITAHDAMHGTITPDYRRLNDTVGAIASTAYALFSWRKLRRYHWAHHDHPVSDDDPDYHGHGGAGPLRWYTRFMLQYLSIPQLVGMALVFNLFQHAVGVAVINLVAFWVLPAVASTVQLFFFGTYLPHRHPPGGHEEPHRAQSNDFGVWLSFVTCYHFGYHREHHERPDIPWWRLPAYRRKTTA